MEELRDVLFLLRGVSHGDPPGTESIQGGGRYGGDRPGEGVRRDVRGDDFMGVSRVLANGGGAGGSANAAPARAAAHAHGRVRAGGAQALWGEELGAGMRVFGGTGDERGGVGGGRGEFVGGGGGRGGGGREGGEFGGGGGGGDGASGPSAFEEIQQVCLSHPCSKSCLVDRSGLVLQHAWHLVRF